MEDPCKLELAIQFLIMYYTINKKAVKIILAIKFLKLFTSKN
jgi:hypothetical protein